MTAGSKPKIIDSIGGAARIFQARGKVSPLKTPFIVQHYHQNLKMVPGAHSATIIAGGVQPACGVDYDLVLDPDSAMSCVGDDIRFYWPEDYGAYGAPTVQDLDLGVDGFATGSYRVRCRIDVDALVDKNGNESIFHAIWIHQTNDPAYWARFGDKYINMAFSPQIVNDYNVIGVYSNEGSDTTIIDNPLPATPYSRWMEVILNKSTDKIRVNAYSDAFSTLIDFAEDDYVGWPTGFRWLGHYVQNGFGGSHGAVDYTVLNLIGEDT